MTDLRELQYAHGTYDAKRVIVSSHSRSRTLPDWARWPPSSSVLWGMGHFQIRYHFSTSVTDSRPLRIKIVTALLLHHKPCGRIRYLGMKIYGYSFVHHVYNQYVYILIIQSAKSLGIGGAVCIHRFSETRRKWNWEINHPSRCSRTLKLRQIREHGTPGRHRPASSSNVATFYYNSAL